MLFAEPEDEDTLFFHQQRTPQRNYKRVRKEPEDLPQALRYFKYANLNPRIAAFLGKQDPKNVLKKSKTKRGGEEDGDNDGGVDDKPNATLGLLGFGDGLSLEARSLLPDIGQDMALVKMGLFDESGAPSRNSVNENDDPQRYQFEQMTFAAPNILKELSETLERFNSSFETYAMQVTLSGSDTSRVENLKPANFLPAGLSYILCEDWIDLIAEAIYTPRVWQSQAYKSGYKYAPTLASGRQIMTASGHSAAADGEHFSKGDMKHMVDLLADTRPKKSENVVKFDGLDRRPRKRGEKEERDSKSFHLKLEVKMAKATSDDEQEFFGKKEIQIKMMYETKSELEFDFDAAHRARLYKDEESSKLKKPPKIAVSASRTNAKVSTMKLSSKQSRSLNAKNSKLMSKSKLGKEGGKKPSVMFNLTSNAKIKRMAGIPEDKMRGKTVMEPRQRYGGNPTISFNLSSKKAFDEGWVVNHTQETELEQNNVLQWATNRLQMTIKEKEAEQTAMKKRGCDKQTILRYYGDSRRDTLMKLYRKSNDSETGSQIRKQNMMPKIPQLSKMDNVDRDRFLVQLPDGSTTIYYPDNQRVAVMASAVPEFPNVLYTNCYDNDDERTCLATFTPYGQSCCYHKNGTPGLILGDDGGILKSDNGVILKKWMWPKYGGKLKENIIFHLNKEMYVRVLSRDNISLNFSCNRETAKIPVGAGKGVSSPSNLSPEHQGGLQSGTKLSSKSALDYSSSYRTRADKRPAKKKFYGLRKTKRSQEVEELKRSLDPPERFEFESQADRELQRLQSKSRCLVEDWMEHYRMAAGITSPALKKLLDKPIVKSPKRTVQSAKERKSSWIDGELEDKPVKFQSFRSPSAPPKHLATAVKRRPGLDDKPADEGDKRPSAGDHPRVQIDELQKKSTTVHCAATVLMLLLLYFFNFIT